MIKVTNMFPILGIDEVDQYEMTPPISDKSATELIEEGLFREEQINRAYSLFQRLISEGKKKDATKIYWFTLLNYQVDFSAE